MMKNLYISYMELSPDLVNQFSDLTDEVILEKLRQAFPGWTGFHSLNKEHNLGIVVTTNRGIDALQVKGPTKFRKPTKDVSFSIFLPEKIELLKTNKLEDVAYYLDLVFSGLKIALSRYDVTSEEIEHIKNECKHELSDLEM